MDSFITGQHANFFVTVVTILFATFHSTLRVFPISCYHFLKNNINCLFKVMINFSEAFTLVKRLPTVLWPIMHFG